MKLKHSAANVNIVTIILNRRIFLCECGKTFTEDNPLSSSKKSTIFKDYKILSELKDIKENYTSVAL